MSYRPPHGTKDTPDIQILPQSTSVDTIPLSPRLNLCSSHASATQHLDPQSQEDLKNEEFLDVPALDDVFDLPLLSPSTGVNLGIETEPLFYLLSSTELDVHPVDI